PQEPNQNAGTEDIIDVEGSEKEDEAAQDYFSNGKPVDKEDQVFLDELERLKRQDVGKIDCNRLNTGSITVKSGRNS
ncbi:hypothetical protein Tco_0329639, partial [Tanacetum coccineum]